MSWRPVSWRELPPWNADMTCCTIFATEICEGLSSFGKMHVCQQDSPNCNRFFVCLVFFKQLPTSFYKCKIKLDCLGRWPLVCLKWTKMVWCESALIEVWFALEKARRAVYLWHSVYWLLQILIFFFYFAVKYYVMYLNLAICLVESFVCD